MKFLKLFVSEWKAMNSYLALPAESQNIVFYAESAADRPHFSAVLESLLEKGEKISYLTSDHNDPILKESRENLKSFCIGAGTVRTIIFLRMKCKILVMTLPDLQNFNLKRSNAHPVHYAYIFHSIPSTQGVYQKAAFDHYDTIYIVGPHHEVEIRKTEEVYGLPAKRLVKHGYGRLDDLIKNFPAQTVPSTASLKKIVLAPSWGLGSFIEKPYGKEIVRNLLSAGHEVTLRLHPMTVRHHPKLARDYLKEMNNPHFSVETNMNDKSSLYKSDLMMTDWSGSSFEFAFTLFKPVLFVNTPQKINNPEYQKIGLDQLEKSIRYEIGDVLEIGEIASINEKIVKLTRDPENFQKAISTARDKWIFNLSRSGEVAALDLIQLSRTL